MTPATHLAAWLTYAYGSCSFAVITHAGLKLTAYCRTCATATRLVCSILEDCPIQVSRVLDRERCRTCIRRFQYFSSSFTEFFRWLPAKIRTIASSKVLFHRSSLRSLQFLVAPRISHCQASGKGGVGAKGRDLASLASPATTDHMGESGFLYS